MYAVALPFNLKVGRTTSVAGPCSEFRAAVHLSHGFMKERFGFVSRSFELKVAEEVQTRVLEGCIREHRAFPENKVSFYGVSGCGKVLFGER